MTSIPPSQQLTPDPLQQPLPAPCYLFKFPNELLAETISWLPHPVDILWLSSTCKRFHHLLIDPAASYIWKRAREQFVMIQSYTIEKQGKSGLPDNIEVIKVPGQEVEIHLTIANKPIPAPFEGQSEYTLARVLFGWKRCQNCGKGYIGPLFSVLMRFALCPDCVGAHGDTFSQANLITHAEAYTAWRELPMDKTAGNQDYFERIWRAVPKEPKERYEGFNIYFRPERGSLSVWTSLFAEFLAIKESSKLRHFLEVTLKAREERVVPRQEHADSLVQWQKEYNKHLRVIQGAVLKMCNALLINTHLSNSALSLFSSELFASSHGLAIEDLQKAPAYRHAVAVAGRHQTVDISPFLIPALPELTSQTLKIQVNRIGDSTNLANKTRRSQIEIFYKQYKFADNIKPTLDTFRSIPILQALQRGISTAGVRTDDAGRPVIAYYLSRQRPAISERLSIEADLRENTVRDLVAVSVLQWREGAMLGARKLLGFERYKRSGKKRQNRRKNKARGAKTSMEIDAVEPSAEECSEIQVESELDAENPMEVDDPGKGGGVDEDDSVQKWHSVPGKLDPEMRVTSWFVCTRCINMDPGYKRMRVLDFRGVCMHECWQKDWGKAQRKPWNIERFALAPKAIETVERMLEILGLDAEDPKTTTHSVKGWWSCNNCPAWMTGMVWEDLLRHCQRHETQDIAQLSDDDAKKRRDALGYKEKRLTFADMLSGQHEVEARTKQLACVHCRPTESGNGDRSHNVAFNATSSKAEKVMDVHGIRQHMKSKHHVSDCRNEDYYYVADDRVMLPDTSVVAATKKRPLKKRPAKVTQPQAPKKPKTGQIIDDNLYPF